MADDGFRKVLIIAYYFPPLGLSGVQRTMKFAKYLSQYGWKPTVLTINPAGYFAFDDTLSREIEAAGVRVVRTHSHDVNRFFTKEVAVKMPSERSRKILQYLGDWFFIPDTKVGWKSFAVKAATELLEHEQFDLIFATAPPQTSFLIGTVLKKRFKLPLVVDYRDSWLNYPFKYFPTPLHRLLHRRLEKRVMKAADRVTVTNRRVKEELLRRYPTMNYDEVIILSQGFDPEDFPALNEKRTRSAKLHITHAGTFYGDRNPAIFFQALSNVLRDNPKMRGRIEVHLIGSMRNEELLWVKKFDLQNVVTFHHYLPHRECAKLMSEADALWFVLDNDYQTPGKLYEYFATRRPILASVVDGYTKQLLNESGVAQCVPLKDVRAHEQALLELFKKFEARKLERTSQEFLNKFNRFTLTGDLARIFEFLMDYDRGTVVTKKETVS
ncbi:MAG TPA: glycosyltransferase family 4 protein [Bacteroidota bacterium]|nr:glycosyltransferase family 4 protein [Bacteroidota bacterium]